MNTTIHIHWQGGGKTAYRNVNGWDRSGEWFIFYTGNDIVNVPASAVKTVTIRQEGGEGMPALPDGPLSSFGRKGKES